LQSAKIFSFNVSIRQFFLIKGLMGCNTWAHESNVRNLCIAVLNSTSKNALSSLLCLGLFFNKISDKGRTGPAWNCGGEGGRVEVGVRGRNDPNNVCTCE
jgi:hypothetical protein